MIVRGMLLKKQHGKSIAHSQLLEVGASHMSILGLWKNGPFEDYVLYTRANAFPRFSLLLLMLLLPPAPAPAIDIYRRRGEEILFSPHEYQTTLWFDDYLYFGCWRCWETLTP